MKPLYAVIVLMTMICSAAMSSINSYRATESLIVHDLNHALEKTLEQKREGWMTPDTLRVYRKNLNLETLKDRAYLSYCLREEKRDGLCSDTLIWRNGEQVVAFKGYANCSMATIFSLSDQRMPFIFLLLTMLWTATYMIYFRRGLVASSTLKEHQNRLSFSDDHCLLMGHNGQPINFTPMQERLMLLFLSAENNCLSKSEITTALWPKKDDADETLYALISRLKKVLEAENNMRIVSDRGRCYRLTVEEPS